MAQVMSTFERYAPAVGIFFCAPILMAFLFGVSILRGGSPIQPGTYGIIVWTIPAWIWVLLQISLCGWAALSAFRYQAKSHAIAASLCGALMEFFAAAAVLGDADEILLVAMAIPTGALCFLSAGIGWDHGR